MYFQTINVTTIESPKLTIFVQSYKWSLIMLRTLSFSIDLGTEFLPFTLRGFFVKQAISWLESAVRPLGRKTLGIGDKGTILTSFNLFHTLSWRFCWWLWASNCFLGYEMVCKCSRKQKCVAFFFDWIGSNLVLALV